MSVYYLNFNEHFFEGWGANYLAHHLIIRIKRLSLRSWIISTTFIFIFYKFRLNFGNNFEQKRAECKKKFILDNKLSAKIQRTEEDVTERIIKRTKLGFRIETNLKIKYSNWKWYDHSTSPLNQKKFWMNETDK